MYFRSYEERTQHIEKIISDYRITAGLYPLVKSVIEKFDGKVFNCRFEKALQADTELKRIYAKKDKYNLSIYWYSPNCNRYMTIASIPVKDLEDEKRINAEKLLDSARTMRENNLKRAAELEQELPKVEMYKARIEDIKKQLHSIVDGIPYELADAFNLRARITSC